MIDTETVGLVAGANVLASAIHFGVQKILSDRKAEREEDHQTAKEADVRREIDLLRDRAARIEERQSNHNKEMERVLSAIEGLRETLEKVRDEIRGIVK